MIYVFLAQGFEEIEALAVVDILRRAELDVATVGIGGRAVVGSHGIPVVVDRSEDEVQTRDMEMVVLPGGMPGTLNLEKSSAVQKATIMCGKREGFALSVLPLLFWAIRVCWKEKRPLVFRVLRASCSVPNIPLNR